MRRVVAIAGVALALSGCAALPAIFAVVDAIAPIAQRVEADYTTAKDEVALWCETQPKAFPCNDVGAMAEINKAKTILDAAFVQAKNAIAAAQNADQMDAATKIISDALAMYGLVLSTYGVKQAV